MSEKDMREVFKSLTYLIWGCTLLILGGLSKTDPDFIIIIMGSAFVLFGMFKIGKIVDD